MTSAMTIHTLSPTDPSTPLPTIFARPRWPYLLGAVAGPVLGTGALVAILAVNGAFHGLVQLALFALALGGALLGVAWLGVLRHGHGGVGAIAGSFAVSLAVVYLHVHRAEWWQARQHGMIFAAAIAACACGHVLVRGLGVVRVLAAIAAVLWGLVFLVLRQRLVLPRALEVALVTSALGAIALTGCALAVMFPTLRRAGSAELSCPRAGRAA